jgi:NAD-dependent SIR2 family protein deacetylase
MHADSLPLSSDLTTAAEIIGRGGVVVLSGAGLSTESGIPDYRGPDGAYSRNHTPITYQLFRDEPRGRHRYWARSYLGWPFMRDRQPNAGHLSIAALGSHGLVSGVITQNVDSLHHKAGSSTVIDLHGRLDTVMCMTCGLRGSRDALQDRIASFNADWEGVATSFNPDGDVEIADSAVESFVMVDCSSCSGPLKPDVVYFGESVPPARVADSYALVDRAASLLVLGSSLQVYSGRRFVTHAHKLGLPIVIINQGETKSDDLATVRIDAPLGATLSTLSSMCSVPLAERLR